MAENGIVLTTCTKFHTSHKIGSITSDGIGLNLLVEQFSEDDCVKISPRIVFGGVGAQSMIKISA